MGLFDSLLKGKEKKVKADALAGDINAAGKSGLSMLRAGAGALNRDIYSNPTDYVQNQIDTENRLLRNATDDAARRAKSLIASRGMGNSSIGLGQEINANRALNEKLALNKASGMDRLKNVYNEQMQTGANLFNVKAGQGPIQMQTVKYRTGGIAGLVGAGVGAYFGGPQGAQAGAGVGQMYANS